MTGITDHAQRAMPGAGRLLAAQVRYHARLLASGRTVTIGIGFPIILLIASHQSGTQTTGADVAQYAVFGLTQTAWNTYGVRLVAARESGILKRWRATPLPRWCYFLGRILATVVVAAVTGAVTVAAGVILYGTHLTVGGASCALGAFVLGGLAWAAAATSMTTVISTVDAAAPTFLVIYFPVIVVSGLLGVISQPHWLTSVAGYLPAQPLAHAAGTALDHTAGQPWLPARDLIVLTAWAVAGIALAIVTFRWEPHQPAHRRPARSSREASHADRGPGSNSSANGAMAATNAPTARVP